MADINVIEHLERVLNENKAMYMVSPKITIDDVRNVLRHLIYVKRYVRNTLNHASEESRIVDEYDEYFSEIGYNVSAELSVGEIESVMREAITLIRTLNI